MGLGFGSPAEAGEETGKREMTSQEIDAVLAGIERATRESEGAVSFDVLADRAATAGLVAAWARYERDLDFLRVRGLL